MLCIQQTIAVVTIANPISGQQQQMFVGEHSGDAASDNSSLIMGDLSYSYAATDIGSPNGSHIKTITVVKNVAAPKYGSTKFNRHSIVKDWQQNPEKNHYNLSGKIPNTGNNFTVQPSQLKDTNVVRSSSNEKKETFLNYEKQAQKDIEHIFQIVKGQPLTDALSLLNQPLTRIDNVGGSDYGVTKEDRSIMDRHKVGLDDDYDDAALRIVPDDVEIIVPTGTGIQLEAAERSRIAQSKRLSEQRAASAPTLRVGLQRSVIVPPHHSKQIETFSEFAKPIQIPVSNLPRIEPQVIHQSITTYKIQEVNDPSRAVTTAEKSVVSPPPPLKVPTEIQPLRHESSGDDNRQQLKDKSNYMLTYVSSVKPYVAPSVKNAFITSSTTSIRPYLAPQKSRSPQTFFLLHEPSSTTQQPYLSPNIYKSYSINKERAVAEQERVKSERDELEREQLEQERQQLHETASLHQKELEAKAESAIVATPAAEEEEHANKRPENLQLLPSYSHSTAVTTLTTSSPSPTALPRSGNGLPTKTTQRHRQPYRNQVGQGPFQAYMVVPSDETSESPYVTEKTLRSYKIGSHRIARHQQIFDNNPPHSFMQSPFRPTIKK